MYPITSAVKALFDSESRQVLRITGTDRNGVAINITDANVLIGGFNIDRYSCNGEKLEVGTAIAAEMTLKLDNHDGTFNGIMFEGTELFVEVGIADWTQDNPTVNWMPCGYFTPDQQPRTANQITIHALDRMVGFDITVDDTAITIPTTVAGLVGQVCTLCGVTLADDISAYTNASVAITALPTAQNMTYRNLIQWCAGVMVTNAWFDWNGELRFSWYENTTGYGMTTANRFSSDYYEDDLTITGVAYINSSGVEIVEGTDDYTIDMTGNALVGPLVATVLPAINTKVNGFTYRPLTATVINAPYLWPMDVVGFTDKNGNTYSSALTNVAYGLNGATALESKGMTYAINAKTQPSGVTKEQAQLITEAMKQVKTDIDESLTQQEIFNRLTDNGAAQGLVLYNGQLYINASFINAGILNADLIQTGMLTSEDGRLTLNTETGEIRSYSDPSDLPAPTMAEIVNSGITFYTHDPTGEFTYKIGELVSGFNSDGMPELVLSVDPSGALGGNLVLTNENAVLSMHDNTIYASKLEGLWRGTAIGVEYGGTGATTAANARTNLGVPSTLEMTAAIGQAIEDVIEYVNIGAEDMLAKIAQMSADKMIYFRTTSTTTNGPRSGVYLIGTAVRAGNNITITASEMLHPETIYQNSTNNAGSTWAGWSGIGCAVFNSATPSTVYTTFSSIGIGKSMPFIITNSDAASFLTGGKSTSLLKGIVARTGATGTLYDFISGAGVNQYMYTWRVTATSAADITPGTVYRYTGTAI